MTTGRINQIGGKAGFRLGKTRDGRDTRRPAALGHRRCRSLSLSPATGSRVDPPLTRSGCCIAMSLSLSCQAETRTGRPGRLCRIAVRFLRVPRTNSAGPYTGCLSFAIDRRDVHRSDPNIVEPECIAGLRLAASRPGTHCVALRVRDRVTPRWRAGRTCSRESVSFPGCPLGRNNAFVRVVSKRANLLLSHSIRSGVSNPASRVFAKGKFPAFSRGSHGESAPCCLWKAGLCRFLTLPEPRRADA